MEKAMNNATLMHYHTVAGMLLSVNNTVVNAALDRAKATVGEATWKAGFSGSKKGGGTIAARSELELIGLKPSSIAGRISSVKLAGTGDDSGNKYQKVRVRFDAPAGDVIVSLDVDSEMAQRLTQKLMNVEPGTEVTFNPFSTPVERSGRIYANHVASLKGADGKEIEAPPNLWAQAQEMADDAENALKALSITDKGILNKTKATKKAEFHLKLLQDTICPRFAGASMPA